MLQTIEEQKTILDQAMFFIKEAGGEFSIYHRLSHSYITSCKTIEETADVLKGFCKMSSEELWRLLISKHRIRIYKDKSELKLRMNEEEEHMAKAWLRSTMKVYERYPGLFISCEEIPSLIINQILQERKNGWDIKNQGAEQEEIVSSSKGMDNEESGSTATVPERPIEIIQGNQEVLSVQVKGQAIVQESYTLSEDSLQLDLFSLI